MRGTNRVAPLPPIPAAAGAAVAPPAAPADAADDIERGLHADPSRPGHGGQQQNRVSDAQQLGLEVEPYHPPRQPGARPLAPTPAPQPRKTYTLAAKQAARRLVQPATKAAQRLVQPVRTPINFVKAYAQLFIYLWDIVSDCLLVHVSACDWIGDEG